MSRKKSAAKAAQKSASVTKRIDVADTKYNRTASAARIKKTAAKIRNSKKLSAEDYALCIALKFRAVKHSLIDIFFEKINSETCVSTHKSSTFVSKFNSALRKSKKTAKQIAAALMLDIRNAVYSFTVREYNSKSQFAAEVSLFDATYSISTDAASSDKTYRMLSLSTSKVLTKVSKQKALAADVALCIKAVKK